MNMAILESFDIKFKRVTTLGAKNFALNLLSQVGMHY